MELGKKYGYENFAHPKRQMTWLGQYGHPRAFPPVKIHYNSLGFNDREHHFKKPWNIKRILVLGDSYVEALQVPHEKSFTRCLEKLLNEKGNQQYEVISLGRSGTGQVWQYEQLTKLGIKFNPEIVLSEFLARNDIIDNSKLLSHLYHNSQRQDQLIDSKDSWSYLLPYIYYRINLFYNKLRSKYIDADNISSIPFDYLVFAKSLPPGLKKVWDDGWENTIAHILKMNNYCKANNIKFALISFTFPYKIDSYREKEPEELRNFFSIYPIAKKIDIDFKSVDKKLELFCKTHGINYLGLNPYFAQAQEKRATALHFTKYDSHWNPNGHRVAADIIYKFLIKKRLLNEDVEIR